MDFIQSGFLAVALSGPVAALIGAGRAALCLFRSSKAKHLMFAILSGLGMLILLVLFAAIIVVWFGYGVAHTRKSQSTDLAILAGTVGTAYLGTFGIWRLALYIEKRLNNRD